jgi:NAD-dependent deacetylase
LSIVTPIQELTELIARCRRILVFTGAGISTSSGIPDYRGPRGLWKTETPVYFEDFLRSPSERLRYWRQRAAGWPVLRDARPNNVHTAIVDLERAAKLHMVVTQNVDGLHLLAGTSREKLIEIHGTSREVECLACGRRSNPEAALEEFERTGTPPRCSCGGWLKPATISFGQALRTPDLTRANRAARSTDLVVALGSTLSVAPAATIPLVAVEVGADYVIINRGPTDHDRLEGVSLRLEGDVGELFPRAVAAALSA